MKIQLWLPNVFQCLDLQLEVLAIHVAGNTLTVLTEYLSKCTERPYNLFFFQFFCSGICLFALLSCQMLFDLLQ